MDSSSLLRIKLGLRTQKKDRGLAIEQMQLWEGYWGKNGKRKGVCGPACKVSKVELQPGTCPGQLNDGEEVDAEWEFHKVEFTENQCHPGEVRRGITTLCSWMLLHYRKGSLFSCLSHGLCL